MRYGQENARPGQGFAEDVKEEFAGLEKRGFRVARTEETLVQYSNGMVMVTVYHGRSSWELGLELSLVTASQGYSIQNVMRAQGISVEPRQWGARSSAEIRSGLRALAQMLETHGQAALRPEPALFARLEEQEREATKTFSNGVRYRQRLPVAEDAFRRRDYKTAAAVYEEIEVSLTPAERQKLEFARKRR